MFNKITIVGRITSDNAIAHTSQGVPYVRFTVAVNRRNFSAQQNEVTDFIPVVAWRSNAEFIARYLNKGSLVLVEGSLHSNQYHSNQTNQIVRTLDVTADQIVALESKSVREARGGSLNATPSPVSAPQTYTPTYKASQSVVNRNTPANATFENTNPKTGATKLHDLEDLFAAPEDLN
ncbi:single-stranded DNA-binding protein [Mycoplasma sp. 4404]|uniref:single-stranded DNA-binding protein n=1 Tax=Mycoplasma sp. 4404 TaxID=3108530 RepID=UPI002B1E08B0|nr:single-stranded DNA-binding protein [Mycoplasma sp. 4404]MEA4162591.1 single-stranded DNA-binding protein [Mycoplasma sp. 4404]